MYNVFYKIYNELAVDTAVKIKFEFGSNDAKIPGLAITPLNSDHVVYVYIPKEDWGCIVPILRKAFAGEPIDLTMYHAVRSTEAHWKIDTTDLMYLKKITGKDFNTKYSTVDRDDVMAAINELMGGATSEGSNNSGGPGVNPLLNAINRMG